MYWDLWGDGIVGNKLFGSGRLLLASRIED